LSVLGSGRVAASSVEVLRHGALRAEITMSAPVLSGDMRAFPLAEILLMLNNNRKTGSLTCSHGEVAKTIDWEKGEIVFARSSRPEDRLGAYLIARGRITQAQLDEASRGVTGKERLGGVLVRLGLLSPGDLLAAVRDQVIQVVFSLFHWKEGRFDFVEGSRSEEKIVLNSTVMNVIMEGARRTDELSRFKEKIQSDRMILSPVKSLEEVAKAARVSELEATVLSLVDGRRTVREIVILAGRGEFDCLQALYALLSAGVIRVQVLAFDP